ncbi:hypothetical protein D0864_15632 [Hortaea werneckii]|uniref:Uncharacterized protein n=1 Tax=Hortaea werneckii TaxID=91943 RepID=A0A3M7BY91_HORWE|nr:hypothetical protein KC319_g16357 [Hortaea werneckii]KAI7678144.1 hypothetical protein KC322_g14999 [Hortaea werneckii]RMY44460.1 hypothetical protein D0864_15632 [Hortaea werneckii]
MSRLAIRSSLTLLLASLLPPPTTALPRPQADDPSTSPATTLTLTTTSTTTLCPPPTPNNPTPTSVPLIQPPSRSPGPPYPLMPAPTSLDPTTPSASISPSTSTAGAVGPPFPTNTTLSLYQGRRCQYRVGSSPISSSECQAFRTEWVGVPRDATRNCTFAVWLGDDFCGSGGGGEVRSTFVESLEGVRDGQEEGDEGGDVEGDEEVCVYVGVLQPGVYHGSGVWTCG